MKQIFHYTVQDGGKNLTGLLKQVADTLQKRKVAQGIISRFEIALEELVLNIFTHGAGDGHAVEVAVTGKSDDQWIDVTILDDAAPFNPLDRARPSSISAELEERPIGGLGIHLVLELMDEVSYREEHGRNCVTLRCRYGADGDSDEASPEGAPPAGAPV